MCHESLNKHVVKLNDEIAAAREQITSLEDRLTEARRILQALEADAESLETPGAVDPFAPKNSSHDSITAKSSPATKLRLFEQRFAGRVDAYAKRWVSRKTGKSGWSPAVIGDFYTDKMTDADLLPLTTAILEQHLRGSGEGFSELHIGLYPMNLDNQTKLLVCDFDGDSWREDATAFAQACGEAEVDCLAEISRSGDGAHVWIFFDKWLAATAARQAGMVLLRRAMKRNAGMSLRSYDRFFPAQDALPVKSPGRLRLGNLIALPLQGDCRSRGTTVFADHETWEPYADQFHALFKVKPVNSGVIEKLAAEEATMLLGPTLSAVMPKRPKNRELKFGLQGKTIQIRRGAMLRIKNDDLPPLFMSELKHRASIHNPEFYRRQAQRFSTFGTPRIVTSFEQDATELRLPRGLADEARQVLKQAGAKVTVRNTAKRHQKQSIPFTGQLRPEQQKAVEVMLQHQDGVLVAPPGSGKTVMGCALIAEREVPTAILVNRAELLEQWRDRLTSFLGIAKESIGQLGNGQKKRTGVVDLVMMQSASHRKADPAFLEEYGQIIVDECHAIAAPATEAAVRTVNVKYWAGLTATPFRADQMDGLITMQCGPHSFRDGVS